MTDCTNLLVDIPVDVAAAILTRWLPAKVLPHVDSAFCCKSGREKLHALLGSPGFVVCGTEFKAIFTLCSLCQQRTVKRWEHARKLKFAQMHLIGDRMIDKVINSDGKLGSHVESVRLHAIRDNSEKENVLLSISTQCPRLQLFHSNRSLLNSHLVQVFRCCKNLQHIRLEKSSVSNDFRSLWLNNITLPHLHTLSIVGCHLASQFVVALVRLSKNLLHFKLEENFHFGGTYLHHVDHNAMICIAKHVPNLSTLCLHTRDLFDATFIEVLTECPHIRNLNIDNCPKLTSASIYSIGQHLTQLQSLTLDGYEYYTEAINFIADRCRLSLHALDYKNGSGYATTGVNTLLQTCPLLCHLTLQLAYLLHNGEYVYDVDINWTYMLNITHLRITPYENDFKDPKVTSMYAKIAANCFKLQYLRLDFTIVNICQLTVIIEYCQHLHTLAFRMNDFFDPAVVERWKSMRPSLIFLDVGGIEDVDVFGSAK